MEEAIKRAIALIGNKRYEEATKVLQDILKPIEQLPEKPIHETKSTGIIKYAKEGLYKLTKSEQIVLIKKLGGTKIPKLEKGRVEYILELQEKQ